MTYALTVYISVYIIRTCEPHSKRSRRSAMRKHATRAGAIAIALLAMMFSMMAAPSQVSASKALSTTAASTTQASAVEAQDIYVAFGDSVPAGYKAFPGQASSPHATECARSTVNYPDLAASSLNLRVFNLACSSATIPAGVKGPQTVQYGDPVQQVTIPSQITQAKALVKKGNHIKLATITVGANDLKWSSWLAMCVNPSTNCATDANTAAFNEQLKATSNMLLSSVKQLSKIAEHIVVTGYYDPMGALAGNPQAYPLTADEVTWYRARLADVNNRFAQVAGKVRGACYLDFMVLNAAAGDVIPLNQPGGGHPSAIGQQELADALVSVISNN